MKNDRCRSLQPFGIAWRSLGTRRTRESVPDERGFQQAAGKQRRAVEQLRNEIERASLQRTYLQRR
jgi:hypothetical protein